MVHTVLTCGAYCTDESPSFKSRPKMSRLYGGTVLVTMVNTVLSAGYHGNVELYSLLV